MIFSSIVFLFRFLPVFCFLYFLAPGRLKNVVLFLGSLVFYAWGEPKNCLLLLFCICFDYVTALCMERAKGGRKVLFLVSLAFHIGLFCFFRYADAAVFGLETLTGVSLNTGSHPLPMGLPIYTLQALSYLIPVYRGECRATKNFLDYAAYISMFPQLVTGPVVEYREIQAQVALRKVTPADVSAGLKRFCVGLGKKVILADGLGQLWNEVFTLMQHSGQPSAMTAWLGLIAFSMQIYFEFSGFSDMAIGLGRTLGFRLPENFDHPYLSASVTEFFDRWFISLTKWFHTYIYEPLTGTGRGLGAKVGAILLIGLLMGAWYGSDWTFLIWGFWMAFTLLLEKVLFREKIPGFARPVGVLYTAAVVLFGWVFFAVKDVTQGIRFLSALCGVGKLIDRQALFLGREYFVLLVIGAVLCTPIFTDIQKKLETSGTGFGIALYRLCEKVIPPVLLLLSIAGIAGGTYHPFLLFHL